LAEKDLAQNPIWLAEGKHTFKQTKKAAKMEQTQSPNN